jgi:hypothetical protein
LIRGKTSSGSAFASMAGFGYSRKKSGRNHIDPLIGALGTQDYSDQELKRIGIFQLRFRFREIPFKMINKK